MKKYLLPLLLVACTLVVAFWQIMARRSAQPFRPFDLTASDFAGFAPAMPGWAVQTLAIATNDPAEPNILALQVTRASMPAGAWPPSYLVRLVHGYNMPMCMKIKGYSVNALADLRKGGAAVPLQVWRVVGSAGEREVWATTMIRAGRFEPTDVDIGSMAFPRVDVPDDPRWVPQGVTWDDVRHPVASIRRWARARWNASRTDVLTFLRLRQPAWASEELLSYVTRPLATVPASGVPDATVTQELAEVHAAVLRELVKWKRP